LHEAGEVVQAAAVCYDSCARDGTVSSAPARNRIDLRKDDACGLYAALQSLLYSQSDNTASQSSRPTTVQSPLEDATPVSSSSTFAALRRLQSLLVMLRYIENIEISIPYRYIVSYRIVRGNIDIAYRYRLFDIYHLTVSILYRN